MTFESLYASFVSYTVLNLAVAQGSHGGGHKLLKMQQTKVQSTFKLLITQNFGLLPALVQNAQQDLILAVMQMCLPSFVPSWQQGNPHFADNRSVVPGRAMNGLFR